MDTGLTRRDSLLAFGSDVNKFVGIKDCVGRSLKQFWEQDAATEATVRKEPSVSPDPYGYEARVAVYDDLVSSPRVEDVSADAPAAFIERLATRTYELARQQGGVLPYTVIREIVENLIHACFREVVVSVLESGSTLRFSDGGPGIPDKEKALEPGFTTANTEMKYVIRGVGSGLPIAREYLLHSGGSVSIEDNLGSGTVITLKGQPVTAPQALDSEEPPGRSPRLSERQKQVLSLGMELGRVGPSLIASELDIAVSTAYRDLAFLEDLGFMQTDGTGKRTLTEDGALFLDELFGWSIGVK